MNSYFVFIITVFLVSIYTLTPGQAKDDGKLIVRLYLSLVTASNSKTLSADKCCKQMGIRNILSYNWKITPNIGKKYVGPIQHSRVNTNSTSVSRCHHESLKSVLQAKFYKDPYNVKWTPVCNKLQIGSIVELPTEICGGNCDTFTLLKLSKNKPIKILIHGWRGHGLSDIFKELVGAYLRNFDYNIITVDWSGLGSKDKLYNNARGKVPGVAVMFAKFLNNLCAQPGVKLENVHIIGHSLGAHIAGIAAYHVGPAKIGRITGLDPAGPMFSINTPRERLSTDSAKFVDVIHTSCRYLGIGRSIGHVDFYPNGPHMFQPGCGADVMGRCSHRRSYYFYAESISKPKAFLAAPCPDWEHFQRKQCDMKRVVPMGESTPATARGNYYISTNAQKPFGKGAV